MGMFNCRAHYKESVKISVISYRCTQVNCIKLIARINETEEYEVERRYNLTKCMK